MAAYGIGVQNRYSAFLDDDEGFLLSTALADSRQAESKREAKQRNLASATGAAQQQKVAPAQQNKTAKQESAASLHQKQDRKRQTESSAKGHQNQHHHHHQQQKQPQIQQQQQQESLGETNGNNVQAEDEVNLGQKDTRNRRHQVGGGEADTNGRFNNGESRPFRGGLGYRGRGRRFDNNDESRKVNNGGDTNMAPRNNTTDRPPQRNRNGFGGGTNFRGGRGGRRPEGEQRFGPRDSDRPKPIPNFSDKLDFPSLAS